MISKDKLKKGAKSGIAQGLLTLLGLGTGCVVMKLVDGKIPGWSVPALGLTGFVPHIFFDNENANAFGNGVIAAGGANALQRATAGKPDIQKWLPVVSVQATLPPPAAPAANGFGNPDYAAMLLNGFGNANPTMAEALVM